ncbi:riboflavin biosynthesis protein RibF [Nonlabens spongiae]|uniref:Riboflavin biosynthesis protein n=1 Tax=Nonlabens spongiae TaxID=331648 RepID=A0A1W6MNS0_9FLAO|nr:bifunctional riboflavin kinase/FAD synthetase [Nonlabens spongiae]ARN79254.1 riboflavin biosynthesis protein RibF [Nonlabens spongiae]
MNTFNNIKDYRPSKGAVVTIGTFDGLHQGHQKILDRVLARSEGDGLTSLVLTFFPHPRMVLQPDHDLKLINTIEERKQLLAEYGIENIVIHPFSKEFSRTTAQEYVEEILVKKFNAKVVVIGYDHRFGRNRSASIKELREYAQEFNFEIVEITKEEVEEVAVSSTKIRNALNEGDVETATRYLNRPFSIRGTIEKGKQLGRTINYPTANLKIEEKYKIIPANGVYVTSSIINGCKVYGMTNVGVNPTVTDEGIRKIETYYLDFDQDLYDSEMELFFHHRLRNEARFKDLELLKKAMLKDENDTRDYIQQMG